MGGGGSPPPVLGELFPRTTELREGENNGRSLGGYWVVGVGWKLYGAAAGFAV